MADSPVAFTSRPEKIAASAVTAFDANREPIYKGESVVYIDESLTREIAIRLEGKESDRPLEARLGTYLLEIGFGSSEGNGYLLQATVFDAFGNHIPFKPDDIQWGLPKEFEILPYSCFRNSLCIELPDPKRLCGRGSPVFAISPAGVSRRRTRAARTCTSRWV